MMCPRGEKNGNWKGGVAEYPNHYEMKLMRIKKLKTTKGLCEICGKKGSEVHHIDKTKTNHSIDNLVVVCHRCHISFFHKQPKKTSKFIRLYGMTLQGMADKFGGSTTTYYLLYKKNQLKNFLVDNPIHKW